MNTNKYTLRRREIRRDNLQTAATSLCNSQNPFVAERTDMPPTASTLSQSAKSTLKKLCGGDEARHANRAAGCPIVGIGREYFAGAYYVTPAPMTLDRQLTHMTKNYCGAPSHNSTLTPHQRLLLDRAALARPQKPV